MVFGRNYGHAGSLEYWSRHYELPPVYSTHNNYWLWGPPPAADVAIVLGNNREGLEQIYEEVIEAGVAETPHAIEWHITIWVCRRLKRPIEDIWRDAKSYG